MVSRTPKTSPEQMISIVLYRPQMPANVGNIIRLCANFGMPLHILGPLDFFMDDRALVRAGLDYRETANMTQHTSFEAYMEKIRPARLVAATTGGTVRPDAFAFAGDDHVLFGRETSGLPEEVMSLVAQDCRLRIPMAGGSRCLNVCNSVAILAYEAMRQSGFQGAG